MSSRPQLTTAATPTGANGGSVNATAMTSPAASRPLPNSLALVGGG